MVPLLVGLCGLTQHQAHATSLAAILPIGLVGAITYAAHGEVDLALAIPFAAGTVAGAPVGAWIMARVREGLLMTLFGALLVIAAVQLLVG